MKKQKFRALNGILLFHKDEGVSSNQILQKIKRLYRAEKAGHSGTLDPFASGLLPILFGEATKFGHYLLEAHKTYTVKIRLGAETDTQDKTGQIIHTAPLPHWENLNLEALFSSFRGKIQQIPPAYSALKVNGQRAYELARQGETVDLSPREVEIFSLNLLEKQLDSLTLSVHCSKGTYIRTLAQDLARAMGSAGHAEALQRTKVGAFENQALNWDKLSALSLDELDGYLLPLTDCVAHLNKINIPEDKYRYIRNGNDIYLNESKNLSDGTELALYFQNKFFGIGEIKANRIFPKKLIAV